MALWMSKISISLNSYLFVKIQEKTYKIYGGGGEYPHLHIVNACYFIIISINKYSYFKPLFSFNILSKNLNT
jgi:hypothetical protein